MDIKAKRGIKDAQGNKAAEYSDIVARAGSWQYGMDACYADVEAEKLEEDLAAGVPNDWKGRPGLEEDPSGVGGK
jgi:hypothetical protein